MSIFVIGVDVIMFLFLVLIPSISDLIAKRKNTTPLKIFQVPYEVKITVCFIILFTFYFSHTMGVGIK